MLRKQRKEMAVKYTSSTICLLYFLALDITSSCQDDVEGYYWRDFSGLIPGDALAGGMDPSGRPIYIGKVLYDDKLIPAKVYEGGTTAYFEFAGAQSTTKNIEILCSQHHESFEWIATTVDHIHLLTGRILIVGGYQEDLGTTTYIGRAVVQGETSVGKVLDGNHDYTGLWTVKDGEAYHFDSFEILTFNPHLLA